MLPVFKKIVLFLICLPPVLFVVLMVKTSHMYITIRSGTPVEWVEYACGIELESFGGHHKYSSGGGIYPTINGQHYYYTQFHHDQELYRVSREELLSYMPEIREKLSRPITELRHPDDKYFYDSDKGKYDIGKDEILERENLARVACLGVMNNASSDVSIISGIEDIHSTGKNEDVKYFKERLKRAARVWVTFIFEWLVLTCWWLFTVWPFMSPKKNLGWSYHIGFSPLLIMMPHYLGYAPLMFTFGPSGTFVYSIITSLVTLPLFFFGGNFLVIKPLDVWILTMLPRPLYYFSQLPGPPLAMSSLGFVGPTVLVLFALFIRFGVRNAVRILVRRLKQA